MYVNMWSLECVLVGLACVESTRGLDECNEYFAPIPVLLPGKSHGRSLVGYSPWGRKELDMTN